MAGPPGEGDTMKLKVCVVGDEGVGKSSLIRRFVVSEFDDRYIRTVGVVVHKRVVVVPVDGVAHTANLTVWDVIGRDEFVGRYGAAYLAGTAGVLAVCDLTRPQTLDNLGRWIARVKAVAGQVPTILLANKRDMTEYVRVTEDQLLAMCELHGVPFMETSAKTGENVELAFGKLAEMGVRNALSRRPRPLAAEEPSLQEAS